MNSMMSPLWKRFGLICALMFVVAQPSALASDTTSSGGIIVIQNEGDLNIAFSSGEVTFVTESGGPAGVSSTTGDTLFAQIEITIQDSRAEGARDPYSISLRLDSPTYGQYYVEASNIAFTNVTGLPKGLQSADLTNPLSAAADTKLINSGDTPPAITEPVTITVSVQMYVPAGTAPGTYTGDVFLTQNGPDLPTQ